jgi:hypothetical protein
MPSMPSIRALHSRRCSPRRRWFVPIPRASGRKREICIRPPRRPQLLAGSDPDAGRPRPTPCGGCDRRAKRPDHRPALRRQEGRQRTISRFSIARYPGKDDEWFPTVVSHWYLDREDPR